MSTLWSSGLGFRRTVKKGIIAGILFSFSLVTIIIISLNFFCWVNMPFKGSLFLKNKPKSGQKLKDFNWYQSWTTLKQLGVFSVQIDNI